MPKAANLILSLFKCVVLIYYFKISEYNFYVFAKYIRERNLSEKLKSFSKFGSPIFKFSKIFQIFKIYHILNKLYKFS